MKKIIYAVDGVVASVSIVYMEGVEVSSALDNAERHEVESHVDVKEGYTVTKDEDGSVTFNKP